jgi:phasin family protein
VLSAEQVIEAHKATIQTYFGMTQKAFEGLEKITELNLQATRASLSETAEMAQTLLTVRDLQESMAIPGQRVQPLVEKMVAYGRHLYDIGSGMSAEWGKIAEARAEQVQQSMVSAVDNAAKVAPLGSEATVAAVKSMVSAASNAIDTVNRAARHASDLADANFSSLAAHASAAASGKATATRGKR